MGLFAALVVLLNIWEFIFMQMTMIEALNSALALELERDKRVVLLGQDIGANGGVFRVTEHLQRKFGEDRVFDTPLSESAIIGSSVGDRKSTRLELQSRLHLVCRLLLEK